MDRRKVLVGACAGAIVIALVIVILRPRTPELVIGLSVIFGAMIYPQYAITVAHANDFAAPDEFVKIAGGLLLLLGVGTMIGPFLAAQAMDHFLPEGLFAFTAVSHLLLGLYTLFRMWKRGAPSGPAFRGVSVAKGGATPESVALDPRSGDAKDEDAAGAGDPDAVDLAREAEAPASEPPPVEETGLQPGTTVIVSEEPVALSPDTPAEPEPPTEVGPATLATGDEIAPPTPPTDRTEPPR